MESFVTTLKCALELCKVSKEILQTAKEVTDGSRKTLMDLTAKAAGIVREDASELREALRQANASGEALEKRYEGLLKEFETLKSYTRRLIRARTISRADMTECSRVASSVLLRARTYFENYQPFKEKLSKAIDVGTRLVERCKVGAQDARASSSDTKIAGYGGTGLLGAGAAAAGTAAAAATGFLAIATGGLGAVVLGIGAVAAGAYTRNRAQELDKLATELQAIQGELEADIRSLNQFADRIEGQQEMTRLMVEELEMKLKLAAQERVGEMN